VSVYIGQINGKFYHTYSKKLRDEYFGDDYVSIFTLGTGRNGAVKIRGSTALSNLISNKGNPTIVVTEIVLKGKC